MKNRSEAELGGVNYELKLEIGNFFFVPFVVSFESFVVKKTEKRIANSKHGH